MLSLVAIAVITHGVSAGEVTATSAVIWARADRECELTMSVTPVDGAPLERTVRVRADDDFTGKVLFEGLRPSTVHHYRVSVDASEARGSFRTAPPPEVRAPVRFIWGGDVGGQNVCRDAREGYPIFRTIASLAPDFFVGLGDMIYADNLCEEKGRHGNAQVPDGPLASDLPTFWGKWRYNREDEACRELLAKTPYFAIWDDHEVVNDFGPLHDTRDAPPYAPGRHLMPLGLKAFSDYNPILYSETSPLRLYRSRRWGALLEIFFLDNRQYRDANVELDSPTRPKTMLGREQLTWLQDGLRRSSALWKVIVSTVPISIPTGSPAESGRDGWASGDQETGFENELRALFDSMREPSAHLPLGVGPQQPIRGMHSVRNVLFITTDVHFAEVFRYKPYPDLEVHEIVTGPLNAGIFPIAVFDATFGAERLFYYAPPTAEAVTSWDEAKRWFNFGVVEIAANGTAVVKIVTTEGRVVFERVFEPVRE